MTNQETIAHFLNAYTRDINTKGRKALSVSGRRLWSYNVCIAEYVVEEGFCGFVIHDHWRKGLGVISSTTSQLVGIIVRATEFIPRCLKSEYKEIFFYILRKKLNRMFLT